MKSVPNHLPDSPNPTHTVPQSEQVILVDEMDHAIGTADKMQAHINGSLHRALSVFIFDSRGRFLLQQRAADKYHSAGLWTNTACSHPRPGEETHAAAVRRLAEEMGLSVPLHHAFSFTYHVRFDDNLTEHEFDHVYYGISDRPPVINPAEVASFRYLSYTALQNELNTTPECFTHWFRLCYTQVAQLPAIRQLRSR
ncbi:MAG: isopentenyl-diphosphate Delta-isomerase [Cyclobacteriaceae bacterium]|nr:isopentenyl-diphosphate Delta-isomerase [Cyclobacteriaceae bacterium]